MKAIGDNLITVARSKRYTARQFRELFLWAIGDAENPPEGCEEAAEFIAVDQREMELRMERRRVAKAERQARWKEGKDARDARDAKDAKDGKDAGDAHHPTIQPSSHPTSNNITVVSKQDTSSKQDTTPPPTPSSDRAAAVAVMKRSFPTLEDVLVAAHNIGVPRDFAERFYADMTRDNWAYVNRHGNTATVNRLCLASVLGGRWRARSKGAAPGGSEEITPEVEAAHELARKAGKH